MLIYLITNTINNKKYVGQTIHSFKQRKRQYYDECKHAKNNIRPVIYAMRKYGINNFKFEIIKDNIFSQRELDELEIYYIKYYNTQIETGYGYNLKYGGNGGKHAESTKKKIGEAQKGERNHMFGRKGKDSPTSIKVIELTSGREFDSATLASEFFNASVSHVCSVCRGERGSTKGCVFRYLTNDNKPIKPDHTATIKSQTVKNKVKKRI